MRASKDPLSSYPRRWPLGLLIYLVPPHRFIGCIICPFLWKQRDPCLGYKRPRGLKPMPGPAALLDLPKKHLLPEPSLGKCNLKTRKSSYPTEGKRRCCQICVGCPPKSLSLCPGALWFGLIRKQPLLLRFNAEKKGLIQKSLLLWP